MGHAYARNFIHLTFSTKGRRKSIPPDLQERLWRYLVALADENDVRILAIGGVEDHVHVLMAIPASGCLSDCISKLKSNSSRWMREQKL